MVWRKEIYSASHAKSTWRDTEHNSSNPDDALLENGEDTFNEDCTFISQEMNSPLICCDGVGSSKDPRVSSYLLTKIFSEIKYEQVSSLTLKEYIQEFYNTVSEPESSTTIIAVWPKIENKFLKLKIFQIGDGMAFIKLTKNGLTNIVNLCHAPANIIGISKIKNRKITTGQLALLEARKEILNDNCMLVPCQIGLEDKNYLGLYYSLGEDCSQEEPLTIEDAIAEGIFLQEKKISLEGIDEFTIVVGSDGVYDNMDLFNLFYIFKTSLSRDIVKNIYNQATKTMKLPESRVKNHDVIRECNEEAPDIVDRIYSLLENKTDITTIPFSTIIGINNIVKKLNYHPAYTQIICDYKYILDIPEEKIIKKYETIKQEIKVMEFFIKMLETPKYDDISLVGATFHFTK